MDETIASGATPGEAASEDVPDRIGRYRIAALLGQGGMGAVYEAEDDELDRRVAIKLLNVRAGGTEGAGRLVREAQALAQLSHPNVVAVFEAGFNADRPYIVMELVNGVTLERWLHDAPRTWSAIVDVFRAAGEGLAAAHEHGIVHRDFKPANVIVGADGRVRVLDFGLATAGDAPPEEEPVVPSPGALVDRLTITGSVMGTPAYMPPEAHLGKAGDPKSDQFSFCVALFEALYGARPFNGNFITVRAKVAQGAIDPPPLGRDVPAWLRRVVERGLAPDPDARWPSMPALIDALRPRRTSTLPWVAALAAVAGLIAVVAATQDDESDCSAAGDRMRAGWNEKRDAVREAMTAGGEEAWTRLEVHIDTYVEALAAAAIENCDALRGKGGGGDEAGGGGGGAAAVDGGDLAAARLDRQRACLERRRLDLEAVVTVFSAPDATARDPRAITDLASVQSCAALDLAEPEPPAELAAAIEALRTRLREANALGAAGRYEDGRAAAAPIVEEARALGFPPVLAEALLSLGKLHASAGDFAAAEPALEEAYWAASEAAHDRIALQAATKLVRVVGHELARHGDGFAWVRHAQSVLARTGTDDLARARVLKEEGSVFHSAGKYEEARARHEEAIQIFASVLGTDHPEYADALVVLSHAESRLGFYDTGQSKIEQAREVYVNALGPQHPTVAEAYNDLGVSMSRLGNYRGALEQHRAALELRTAALGPRHASVGRSHHNIGGALLRRGEFAEAVKHLRSAVAIRTEAYGESHPDVGSSMASLGISLYRAGDRDAGQRTLQRALDIRIATVDPGSPRLRRVLLYMGETLLLEGKVDEARKQFESFTTAFDPGTPHAQRSLAFVACRIGHTHLLQEHPELAAEHFERAARLQASNLAPRHPDRALAFAGLAEVRARTGDPAGAREALAKIDALYELGPIHEDAKRRAFAALEQ